MKKIISLAALASLLVVAVPLSVDAAVIGSLTFSPNPVNQGSSVSITGACGSTNASGTVNISLTNGSTTQTSSVVANSSGDFTANVAVSSTFPTGSASVTATCPNGDTVTGTLTVNQPISTTLTLSGTPTLGQSVTISGSCGTTSSGGTVSVNLVRNGVTTNLGTTTTTSPNGAFSSSFTIPSTYGGGPVTITAVCPTGTISFNTSVVDPFASVIVGTTTPTVGGSFTASGMCGTAAGNTVSFSLSNASTTVSLGTTTATAGGNFSTVLTVPSTFGTGPAVLVATCPTGNVATAGLTVGPAAVFVPAPIVFDPGDEGDVGGVDTTPFGGVAAGKSNNLLIILGFTLMGLGAAGFIGAKKIAESLNDPQ